MVGWPVSVLAAVVASWKCQCIPALSLVIIPVCCGVSEMSSPLRVDSVILSARTADPRSRVERQ